jgi:hypothetical protein
MSERTALLVLVAVLCFPTAFYLCVIYTESLFLALLFGFLNFYQRRSSWWSLPLAALLPLTRGQGFFLFGGFVMNVAWRLIRRRPIRHAYELSNALAFLVGMGCYFTFFWLVLDDPFAGIKAQEHFYFKVSIQNLLNPAHFLSYLFSPSPIPMGLNDAMMDKVFIVFMLLGLVPVALQRNSLYFFFYLVLVYCPAAMGHGGSYMRFALLAFPFLVIACVPYWTRCLEVRMRCSVMLLVFVILQISFISMFALMYWVG